mgnify:CR=1 FL=1
MEDLIIDMNSGLDITARSAFSRDNDIFTSRSFNSLLLKNCVPYSHKKIADDYVIIKKIFGFQAVKSRISNTEKSLLAQYSLKTLEYTTIDEMYDELALLQQWAQDETMKEIADNILKIRAKELKFITAMRYTTVSDEIYKGYIVLENYFTEISKYND